MIVCPEQDIGLVYETSGESLVGSNPTTITSLQEPGATHTAQPSEG